MADNLSKQDIQDLMEIRARLPKGDPRVEQLSTLISVGLSANPTEVPGTAPTNKEGRAGSESPSTAKLLYQATTNPASAGANPNSFIGGARQIGGRATGAILAPAVHPIDTAAAVYNTIRHPLNAAGQRIGEFKQEYQQSPALAFENAAGDVLGSVEGGRIGGAAAKAAEPLGAPLKSAGEGIINRTIGATKADFARGANPGKGYFQAGLGPSATMGSIADKAERAHEAAGANIGGTIDAATSRGVTIPSAEGVQPIAAPLNRAHAVMSGPGGGGAGAIEDLSSTFRPSIQNAAQSGGFSPRDYFDIKHNVAQNTSWGDPSQIGLKSVRQQITGGMGGKLAEHVPELQELNPEYANTGKLAERAGYRADTGISPLTQMGRRTAEGAIGYGLGQATGHPLMMAAPLALDSVPIRTGVASGLYYGGQALPSLLRPPLRLASPAAAISGVNDEQP